MRAQSMSPTCAIHLGRARRGALLCALTVLELAGVHGRTAQPRTIDQLMNRAAAQTAIDSGGDRLCEAGGVTLDVASPTSLPGFGCATAGNDRCVVLEAKHFAACIYAKEMWPHTSVPSWETGRVWLLLGAMLGYGSKAQAVTKPVPPAMPSVMLATDAYLTKRKDWEYRRGLAVDYRPLANPPVKTMTKGDAEFDAFKDGLEYVPCVVSKRL